MNLKSDCIYHFPIGKLVNLEQQTNGRSFAAPNQPENGKYNLISGKFIKIWKRLLCVRGQFGSLKAVPRAPKPIFY